MKRITQFAITLMLGICFSMAVNTVNAQVQAQEYNIEDASWQKYIMDGDNQHFVWARQVSPTKLAIGLVEGEGYISLENDTCIWFRDRNYADDQLIATIEIDKERDQYLFFKVDEFISLRDTIGIYSPNMESVFDKNYNIKGIYNQEGQLRDTIDNIVLLKTNGVNRILSSFYFLSFYLREREMRMNITKSNN